MYGTIYTPSVDRSDAEAIRDLLRSAPLDELAYIAHRDACLDLYRCTDPREYHRGTPRSGRREGRRTA